MKKSLNILLLFAFAMSITVWSCKPKEVVSETVEQMAEEVEQAVQEAAEEVVEVEETPALNKDQNCKYKAMKGKATVSKLNFSNTNEVIIKFTFEKNDHDVSVYPEVSNENIVLSIDGKKKYPSKDWCAENGIEKGATFNCVRYELVKDTGNDCAKVKFSFTDFEDSGL